MSSTATEAAPATSPSSGLSLPAVPEIQGLLETTRSCVLRPLAFFVSWQGVLTLAYRGFPPALLHAKAALNDVRSLPAENSGSKWPKTSLGALRDDARLTPEQLELLSRICKEESGRMVNPPSPRSQAVLVNQLAAVVYECRSLERQLLKLVVPLQADLDTGNASPAERARVEAIVAEADDPGYWFHVSRDGSRETHYRGTALGVTLVHELACFQPPGARRLEGCLGYGHDLPGLIARLRERVDRELPCMYRWFDDASLHITIRALFG